MHWSIPTWLRGWSYPILNFPLCLAWVTYRTHTYTYIHVHTRTHIIACSHVRRGVELGSVTSDDVIPHSIHFGHDGSGKSALCAVPVTSHHITLHRNTSQSHHNTSRRITSHHNVPHHTTPHHTTPRYITVRHKISHHIISQQITIDLC